MRRSKLVAWGAFVMVVMLVVLAVRAHGPWWSYLDEFFAFMMVFFHLLAVYMYKAPGISKQLDVVAFVFCGLTMCAFLGQYIAGL